MRAHPGCKPTPPRESMILGWVCSRYRLRYPAASCVTQSRPPSYSVLRPTFERVPFFCHVPRNLRTSFPLFLCRPLLPKPATSPGPGDHGANPGLADASRSPPAVASLSLLWSSAQQQVVNELAPALGNPAGPAPAPPIESWPEQSIYWGAGREAPCSGRAAHAARADRSNRCRWAEYGISLKDPWYTQHSTHTNTHTHCGPR